MAPFFPFPFPLSSFSFPSPVVAAGNSIEGDAVSSPLIVTLEPGAGSGASLGRSTKM